MRRGMGSLVKGDGVREVWKEQGGGPQLSLSGCARAHRYDWASITLKCYTVIGEA